MPADGLVLIVPSSATVTGTGSSATINANGSVSFTCNTLTLEGVFSSSYDTYVVSLDVSETGATFAELRYRWRASGSDSTTGYAHQDLNAVGNTLIASRSTVETSAFIGEYGGDTNLQCGTTTYLFDIGRAVATKWRSMNISRENLLVSDNQKYHDISGFHNVATAYTGLVLYNANANRKATGLISVYGFNQ
jgi:hypothetical protein